MKKRKAKNAEKFAKRQKIREKEAAKFSGQAREVKKKKYIKAGKERASRLLGKSPRR